MEIVNRTLSHYNEQCVTSTKNTLGKSKQLVGLKQTVTVSFGPLIRMATHERSI